MNATLTAIASWAAGVVSAALEVSPAQVRVVGAELWGAFPTVVVEIGESRYALAVEYRGPAQG